MATEISEVGQTVHNHNEQYLTFFLADQEYGVEILKVQGIQGWDEVTSLPNSPDYLLGVINLRGAIVPIVDLRKMFKLRKVDYNSITVVIVVKVNYGLEEKTVGMVVDAVSEVYNINAENMNASPEFGEGVDTQYVMGLATIDEKMIILLDVDHLIGEGVLDVEAEEPEVH
ncbi:MAG: purine-binding chemotaxis protein CheW [Pseudomonadales bacterium]|nr:purine-binding chemotaxis protein CheW [Pseudomonadales bacterium]